MEKQEEEKYDWAEKYSPPEQDHVKKREWTPPLIKQEHEMTDEELWLSCPESYDGKVSIDVVKDKHLPILKNYWKQLHQSQGFDLDENPRIGVSNGGIFKAKCCQESYPEEYKEYMTLAQLAIDETYNKDKIINLIQSIRYSSLHNLKSCTYFLPQKTDLKVLEVKSVNASCSYARVYYMTFTAGDPLADSEACKKKTFQATVSTWNTFGNKKDKYQNVMRCRLKV